MGGEVFQQVLSIGQSCRARHHARRIFGKNNSGRKGVFDWQITPVEALLKYLERDFVGMLERSDLAINRGSVENTRFGTIHYHEFPELSQLDDLDARYPIARRRHDRWCAYTRNVMANDYSALFVLAAPVADEAVGRISEAIGRFNPRKRFLVLNGPENDHGQDWTGDTDVWTKHLEPFTVRPPALVKAGYICHRLKTNVARLANREHFRPRPLTENVG